MNSTIENSIIPHLWISILILVLCIYIYIYLAFKNNYFFLRDIRFFVSPSFEESNMLIREKGQKDCVRVLTLNLNLMLCSWKRFQTISTMRDKKKQNNLMHGWHGWFEIHFQIDGLVLSKMFTYFDVYRYHAACPVAAGLCLLRTRTN